MKKSKKDTLLELLTTNDYFACPKCGKDLYANQLSLYCSNKHTFNINKKGFLFLNTMNRLPVSALYNNSLFNARREIILSGLYDNIYEEIIKIINKFAKNAESIIDIGSGEASHLLNVSKKIFFKFKLAIDLSKDAISMASDYVYDGIIPSLSDVENIPLKDGCIDVILDFLSPISLTECFRVLNNNGILIKIMPTHNYLKEIREALNIKKYDNETNVEKNITNKYKPIYKTLVEYKKSIDEATSQNLLKMTPLSFHKDIGNILIQSITISLKILVLKNESKS